MNILVTSVGGDIGQSVIKCLRESGYNLSIVGCDMDRYAAGRAMVDAFEQSPRVGDGKEYLKFIDGIIDRHNIKYVFPISEAEVWFHNKHRDHFTGGADVMINNPRVVDVGFDKYKMVEMLEAIGLPYPKTYRISKFAGNLGYPFLIKASRGYGRRGVVVARNYADVKYYRSRIPDAIAQEIIGTADDEYTVGVFSDGKKVYLICFRRYLGYGSLSKFVELVHSDEMYSIVKKIVEVCHLEGSMNVQFRKSDKGYVPFEINARLSSSVYFRHWFGFRDVEWWLDMKEHKPIAYNPKFKKGIGVRTVGEVFFEVE